MIPQATHSASGQRRRDAVIEQPLTGAMAVDSGNSREGAKPQTRAAKDF
jgi:hypothetical protein